MKKTESGREQFKKFKFLLSFMIKCYSLFPLKIRKKIFEKKRFLRGKFGIAVRYALLKSIAKKVGDNVAIHQGCYILNAENLVIGDNVSIHPMCYIEALGGVEIGNDVSIAHATTILSTSHTYKDVEIPIKYQKVDLLPTKIGDNVWLGAKSTILGGISIESGCVVGAGAVVTHNVKTNSIVAGVPAKIIKER